MRKLLLVASVLFVFSGISRAQYTTVVTDGAGGCSQMNQYNSIVRNWDGTEYSLTCSEEENAVFRAMKHSAYTTGAIAPTFPVYEVTIPAPLDVIVDFRIIGDYVCFSGYERTTTPPWYAEHYLGFFKMSELISGSLVNYKLMHMDNAFVERIEGFSDNDGFRVFGVGGIYNGSKTYCSLFEVNDPPTATGYSYAQASVPLNDLGTESFDDIVVLQDRVVFVGTHLKTTPFYQGPVAMRWVSKSLGLSDPQLGTRYYQTATTPFPEREVNSRLQAKPISEGKFVIAYTFSDYPAGVSTRRIRMFDLNMTGVVSQEFSIYSKLEMYDMAYNQASGTLTVLEPDATTSRFVFVHPGNISSYNALTLFDTGNEFFTLDTISPTQFISTRKKNWLFQVADQLSYNPSMSTNNCLSNNYVKVAIIPQLIESNIGENLILNSVVVGSSTIEPVTTCTLPVVCTSY